MTTQRLPIKNQLGLKLVIQIDTPDDPKHLVFIEPGQGGTIEQKHISAFAEAFLEHGFRVVRFDPTHSVGESEGDIIDVTYDSYLHDLEDVIGWARSQEWFSQPFALCGHSMGAQATAWYAEAHPDEVSLLAPMAPVVNYDLYISTLDEDYKNKWKQQGYIESVSRSKPGLVKRVGWGVNESIKKFDLLPNASRLNMPVINIVGEQDQPCPPKHQQIFMDKIGSPNKSLVIIPGTEHSYRNAQANEYGQELQQVKDALNSWLSKTLK